jgi:hypothetical protein
MPSDLTSRRGYKYSARSTPHSGHGQRSSSAWPAHTSTRCPWTFNATDRTIHGDASPSTGIGAYVGNIFFVEMPLGIFALVEGVAAGAMLTMIAETMLPEAYHRGGAVTGISTLLGFLAAIFFKTLE